MKSSLQNKGRYMAFSLVEVMVSLAILVLVCLLSFTLIDSTRKIWTQTSSRTEQFREARRAFERITQTLSQATLNTYWDYVDVAGNPRTVMNAPTFQPARYARQSELRYIQVNSSNLIPPHAGALHGQSIFFQAPLGNANDKNFSSLNSIVNTVGFYIERGSSVGFMPNFISQQRIRYRLFEMNEPSERLTIYSYTSGNAAYNGTEWFTEPMKNIAYSSRLSENIVALLFRAEYQDGSVSKQSFNYSSAPVGGPIQPVEVHNLPPSVRVTMLAIDETSAKRLVDMAVVLIDATDDVTLNGLENQLISLGMNYRKFESTVRIGASNWSAL